MSSAAVLIYSQQKFMGKLVVRIVLLMPTGLAVLLQTGLAIACPQSLAADAPAPADSLELTTRATEALQKVTFDLSELSAEGLTGPADGQRSQRYEFCIPQGDRYRTEVQQIDPGIELYPHSRGRIGCDRHQTLVIGDTHNPNWHSILLQFAQLDYVERIDPSWGE